MRYEHLRMAVCDDIPAERQAILAMVHKYLDRNHHVVQIDEFPSGEALLEADASVYDLIILDIFMDKLNGIETAKKLIEANARAQIIFCSTSNEFATESYDVFALRYLTKPVQEDKLFYTLDRFFHAHTSLRTVTYKQNRMDETVYVSEILWVEAGDHKSIIHTSKGDITTGTQFKQLCEQLQNCDFVKPIRYAFVSLQAVAEIPNDVLTLVDGSIIPISRGQRGEMKKCFSDYKMKALLKKGGLWS